MHLNVQWFEIFFYVKVTKNRTTVEIEIREKRKKREMRKKGEKGEKRERLKEPRTPSRTYLSLDYRKEFSRKKQYYIHFKIFI